MFLPFAITYFSQAPALLTDFHSNPILIPLSSLAWSKHNEWVLKLPLLFFICFVSSNYQPHEKSHTARKLRERRNEQRYSGTYDSYSHSIKTGRTGSVVIRLGLTKIKVSI